MVRRLHSQKRKKLRKAIVVVPEPGGELSRRFEYWGHIDLITSVIHSPVSL